MGESEQKKELTIEFDCEFRVNMRQSDFPSIMKAFLILLPQLLADFFQGEVIESSEADAVETSGEHEPFPHAPTEPIQAS